MSSILIISANANPYIPLSWHGTADTTLGYPNFAEDLKQWSNVLKVEFSKDVAGDPSSQYTKKVYGDGTQLVGYSGQGVGHTVPIHEAQDLAWFGIA